MTVTLLECGVCGKPARDRCEHLAAILNVPAATHWDSPEGQTQSCANCDMLAAEHSLAYELLSADNLDLVSENAKLRGAAAAAVGAWTLTASTPTLEDAMRDLEKLVEGCEP